MAGRKMTPKGQMAFGGGPPITHLPPAMKAMFQPGPPLPYKEKLCRKRKCQPLSGIASWAKVLFETTEPPERVIQETPQDRRRAKRVAKVASNELKLTEAKAAWDPRSPEAESVATKDAYKTLFVGRLSYETTEAALVREFEQYGPIISSRLVKDGNGKPRGYAFLEFETESDMRKAYKRADGRRIDNRRILVDVERGRTVRNWKPRRLGGGLGGASRKRGAVNRPQQQHHNGGGPSRYAPPPNQYGSRGGDRLPPRGGGGGDSSVSERDRRRRDRSRSRDRHQSRRY